MPSGRAKSGKRHLPWFLIFLSVFIFMYRAWSLQLNPDPRVLDRLGLQSTSMVQTSPIRGPILDKKGEVLAISVPVTSIYIDPEEWDNGDLGRISPYLSKERIEALKTLKGGRFFWLLRHLDGPQAKGILDLGLEGVHGLTESKRVYPGGSLLSHVIGFCDIDGVGLAGLEMIWNDALYVPPERRITPRTRKSRDSVSDGGVIRLTIDRRIQYIIEKNLAEVASREKAKWAAAICVESNTGKVAAMASWPTFDANVRKTMLDSGSMVNNCVSRVYEPGSTFKPMVIAMRLQSGAISRNSRFMDRGRIKVADGWISNSHGVGKGDINLPQVLMYSSNVAMATIGMKWNPYEAYKDLMAWGFGSKTGIEINGEEAGLLLPPERWYGVIPANIAIGQGIAVTPLQLVMAFNSVIAGGALLKPHLVEEVLDHHGNVVYRSGRDVIRELISPFYVDWFRKVLRQVVTDGTGKRADVPSVKVGGKTGTAQVAVKGKYAKERMVGSFIGFWPYDSPRYTLLIVIGEPGGGRYYGGELAAPLFRTIVEDIGRLESGE